MDRSRSRIPKQPIGPAHQELRPFEPPEQGPNGPRIQLETEHHIVYVHRDLTRDESNLEAINDHGGWHFPDIDLKIPRDPV